MVSQTQISFPVRLVASSCEIEEPCWSHRCRWFRLLTDRELDSASREGSSAFVSSRHNGLFIGLYRPAA